ncbi:hypothetical protein ISN44_As02g007150 [Arabidopsis suecica]|uniref:Uncharacterized protein n=1 Tax=Arabidopsis suecica TaxID=45249 RepID=A0A8T2FXI6_ARASU|nr:hypothetical protein ISN44_As02g007150 [Arabidopsis suecica]
MHPEPHTIRDDMMDTSSDRETDTGIPQAPNVLGLPPLNTAAIRAEQDPTRCILFTPVTGGETDHVQVARPPAAPTAPTASTAPTAPTTLAATEVDEATAAAKAAKSAAQRRTTAADRGPHLNDLVQTILDQLDGHEARTTERIDALVAAQVTSKSQIDRLRRRKRTSQPHDDQDGQQSPRTPVAERSEIQCCRPASVILGFIDEHSCDSPQYDHNLQSGHNLHSIKRW